MSEARQTEILEKAFNSDNDRIKIDVADTVAIGIEQAGWTSERFTEASAPDTQVVKSDAGKVAMLLVEDAEDVTLKDGTTDLWDAVNNDSVDWSRCPLTAETNITLHFAGNTSAWIVYK